MKDQGRKLALLIASDQYEDPKFSPLDTPMADIADLRSVLLSDVCAFNDVRICTNKNEAIVRREIARFFLSGEYYDLLLLYFSCHGLLDTNGSLFFIMNDTERKILRATGVSADFVRQEMDDCIAKKQLLILDCCYSGAVASGAKSVFEAVRTQSIFGGGGRIILTASDSTQFAWEGDKTSVAGNNSVFTYHLIQGLKTGKADLNNDGQITTDELYEYIVSVMKSSDQSPMKFTEQNGVFVIGQNIYKKKEAHKFTEYAMWWKDRDYSTNPFSDDIEKDRFIDIYVDPYFNKPGKDGNFHFLEALENKGSKQQVVIFASKGCGKTFCSILLEEQLRNFEHGTHTLRIHNLVDLVPEFERITEKEIANVVYKQLYKYFHGTDITDICGSLGRIMEHIQELCASKIDQKLKNRRVIIFLDDIDNLFEEGLEYINQNRLRLNAILNFCKIAARRDEDICTYRFFMPKQLQPYIQSTLKNVIHRVRQVELNWSYQSCNEVIERRVNELFISGVSPDRLLKLFSDETINAIELWQKQQDEVSPGGTIGLYNNFTYFASKNYMGTGPLPLEVWEQFLKVMDTEAIMPKNIHIPH
jgi:hypothetical protein